MDVFGVMMKRVEMASAAAATATIARVHFKNLLPLHPLSPPHPAKALTPFFHTQTQEWTHPPFSGAVADGFVWGRGSIDVKLTVVTLLESATALLAKGWQPERTLIFAFGQDEEVGGAYGAGGRAQGGWAHVGLVLVGSGLISQHSTAQHRGARRKLYQPPPKLSQPRPPPPTHPIKHHPQPRLHPCCSLEVLRLR